MARIELSSIEKSYGQTQVIHGIDLCVESGEFCVFVGPSGCGKSTLLRMIAGLESVSAGDILIEGERVNDVPAAGRGLAMVFQSYALYPHMSVRKNLSFGLENLNMPKQEIVSRVEAAATMLQIDAFLERKPGQLSGGQRQRVAIGRAVVREPRVFLFDEPLSNLDAELRVTMRGEISALHRRLGNSMIYVTHDQVEAMTMADKIAVLRLGRLEQFGRPLDLYNYPANEFVAGFIGSPRMNFLDGQVIESSHGSDHKALVLQTQCGAKVPLDTSEFDLEPGQAVRLGVRAQHLDVDGSSAGLACTVASVEQLGGETFVYASLASGEPITLQRPGQADINRGDLLTLGVLPGHAHVFAQDSGRSLRRER